MNLKTLILSTMLSATTPIDTIQPDGYNVLKAPKKQTTLLIEKSLSKQKQQIKQSILDSTYVFPSKKEIAIFNNENDFLKIKQHNYPGKYINYKRILKTKPRDKDIIDRALTWYGKYEPLIETLQDIGSFDAPGIYSLYIDMGSVRFKFHLDYISIPRHGISNKTGLPYTKDKTAVIRPFINKPQQLKAVVRELKTYIKK